MDLASGAGEVRGDWSGGDCKERIGLEGVLGFWVGEGAEAPTRG